MNRQLTNGNNRSLALTLGLAVFLAFSISKLSVAVADEQEEEQGPTPAAETSTDEKADNSAPGPGPSASEIAAELASPNTVLGSLAFNNDYISYKGDLPGANNQDALRVTFQPVLPYPVGEGVNVFFRPAIPFVLKQDVPTTDGYYNPGLNLGDTTFDLSVGKTFKSGWIVVAGMAGTLPTATDDRLGNDQWALGPEVALAYGDSWGVVGLLASHQWDVGGNDAIDTNVTAGQYFYTFNLGDGWQVTGTPTWSYNHEGRKGERWTLPLAVGVNKTTILNGRPWKFGLQYWHYVKTPDTFGPDFQVRLTIAPVVPLPWSKK